MFMTDQFTALQSAQIQTQLDSRVALDDVDVYMRLSVLKKARKERQEGKKARNQLPKHGSRRALAK